MSFGLNFGLRFSDFKSRVARVPVLRQEELVAEAVHLQQAVAGEFYFIPTEDSEAFLLHPMELWCEALQHVFAEFLGIVRRLEMAEFHFEHELADEALLRAGGVGVKDGAPA